MQGRTETFLSNGRLEKGTPDRQILEATPTSPWPPSVRVVARRDGDLVFLALTEIWAFEAAQRLNFVHCRHGTFDIDVSLAEIEASVGKGFTRVHRNWLVNLAHIKALERRTGQTTLFVGIGIGDDRSGIHVPVSRSRAQSLRDELLANAIGLRK